MANQKGNLFLFWIINGDYAIHAVDTNGQVNVRSKDNFAMDIAISEDGTVWVLSTEPDPDGGGAKIFWGTGDDNWNEINTPESGGVAIAGGPASSCYYIDGDSAIRQLQTNGSATTVYSTNPVIAMDYGGGYMWAILQQETTGEVGLYYSKTANGLDFQKFAGDALPQSISVAYNGDCYGVQDMSPFYYSTDGSSTGSAGAGADGIALQFSFKAWSYLLSSLIDGNNQNLVLRWEDNQGGMFVKTNIGGMRIAATYHQK